MKYISSHYVVVVVEEGSSDGICHLPDAQSYLRDAQYPHGIHQIVELMNSRQWQMYQTEYPTN